MQATRKNFKRIKRAILVLFTIALSLTGTSRLSANGPTPGVPSEIGKIEGVVQDSGDKLSIPYATIALYSKQDSNLVTGTMSDSEGRFVIDKVENGDYYVVIDFIGYSKKILKNITIEKGKKDVQLGTILLEKAVEAIAEVEITADKDAVSYRIDKKVINMSQKPEAAGGTVVNALENTPSIQVDAEGNVSLRGSTNFTVMINGKPTQLTGSDALKSIPASTVETVEIITNPSAKYAPDGTAGIINIIMKKGYETGLNGIVNASIGTQWKHSADFSLNYRTDKINYFLSANYAQRPQFPSVDIYSERFFNDTLTIVNQHGDRKHYSDPYNIKGGLDFYITNSDMFTLSGEYGHWGFGMDMDALTKETTLPASSTMTLNTLTKMRMGGIYKSGTASYDHDFSEGHDWVTSFNYRTWDGSNNTDITETDLTTTLYERNKGIRLTDNFEVKIKSDYSKNFSPTSKFEAGYQYQIKDENMSYDYQNFNQEIMDWVDNVEFSSLVNFVRGIHSVYSTYGNEVVGVQYQLGLRAEYTDRNLLSSTGENLFNYQKSDLFPTLHLSKQLPKDIQMQASYSRRINRPESWNLNPFPMYSDRYIRQGGNPNLLPEYTDSYEFNTMKRMKLGFVSAEAFYRKTKDTHEQTLTLQSDGIVLVIPENLDNTYAYGIELSSNLRPVSWLNIFASANLYNYEISGMQVSEDIDTKTFKSDFVLNLTFSPTKTTRLQLTGFYNAPTLSPQGYQSEMFGVNTAVSQEFMKRKLTVSLNAQNIFNTMKFAFDSRTTDLLTTFSFNMEYPVINLAVSYKINNYQKRQTPEDEQPAGGGGMM